jgi:MYXO-CTERM domain-containing protein
MRSSLLCIAALSSLIAAAAPAAAATLSVGPGQTFMKPCDAIAKAQPGDIIEVDAAGTYDNDTCAWSTDNLTVRGINGRAKIALKTVGPAQKKGIFTIAAKTATIENMELSGAAISAADGNNGAGIRHQGLNLTVRGCFFHDNQDGILGGPLDNGQPADGQGEVLIERSEFFHNGAGDGFSHNMYIGHYGKFTLRASWSHAALVGHLVKTRAAENYILYNRITGEDGTDSYEIDVPNGGKTYILGNLIQQGAATQNPAIITYEEEGMNAANPLHELFVVNNSIVNELGKGTFVHVAGGVAVPAVIQNNIFVGPGTAVDQMSAMQVANYTSDPMFVDQAMFDYHLKPGSPCVDMGQAPGMGDGYALAPDHEYVHPADFEGRMSVNAIDIGAYELGGGSSTGAGGGSATSTSATTGAGTGTGAGGAGGSGNGPSSAAGVDPGPGATGSGGSGGAGSSSGMSGGCGCDVPGKTSGGATAVALVLGAAWVARRRRRG